MSGSLADVEPERRAYYQLQSGRVVQVTGELGERLHLTDPATGQTWDTSRESFVEGLTDGYVQRVRPAWELAGDGQADERGRT